MLPLLALSMSPAAGLELPKLKVFAFYSQGSDLDRAHLERAADVIDVLAPQWYTLDLDRETLNERAPDEDVMSFPDRSFEVWPVVNSYVVGHSERLEDPLVRLRVVASIQELARRYSYEGITLDMEGVAPAQREAFTAFVRELFVALKGEARSLAVYVPRRTEAFVTNWAAAYDWQALTLYSDLLLPALYPENHEHPGRLTTKAGMKEVLDYAAGISHEDIAPLVGSIGFRWQRGLPRPIEVLPTKVAAREMRAIGTHVRKRGGETRYGTGDSVVWFENLSGLKARARLARSEGFRWVSFFSLAKEPKRLWDARSMSDAP